MKNRAILSRIGVRRPAKRKIKTAPPVVKKEKEIVMVDPETEEIIETFTSLEDAIEKQRLNRPNLIGAVKNGNKYKGMLWKEA